MRSVFEQNADVTGIRAALHLPVADGKLYRCVRKEKWANERPKERESNLPITDKRHPVERPALLYYPAISLPTNPYHLPPAYYDASKEDWFERASAARGKPTLIRSEVRVEGRVFP